MCEVPEQTERLFYRKKLFLRKRAWCKFEDALAQME